ncbi:hypothetical protein [Gracilibacillus ureilyticus]|uniref:hypothetical protein n=1 Tax=Gracilibacillus ureilyticus TaxID=531814 RepID=UPI000B7FE79C|nr:hypothetical protein [Gracilibacillus ureilyticus]
MNGYNSLLVKNDEMTMMHFEHQVKDKGSRYFGGIINQNTGIPSPSHTGTGSVIGSWVCSYVNKDSAYFENEELAERIEMALDYMLNKQHNDGTISPGWTNYHSPPDTAFIVTGFAQIYSLLKKNKKESFADKVALFLKRTIPAMLTGGCHTPNHRWVLASALAHLYNIFGNLELKQRAEEWLLEGMDMTEDGEWTERSNGIYNSVSNICLYHTASLLGKTELYGYIRKNLDMMMYLVHPDGEVVTDYSGRQDLGNRFDLSPYHLIYRLMAYKDTNPQYMSMADLALENMEDTGPVNNHMMLGYLYFPFIKEENIDRAELPKEYEVFINEKYQVKENMNKMEAVGHYSRIEHSSMHTSFGAQTVRYRNKDISATIMGMNSSIFSLRHGKIKLLGTQIYTSFSPGVVEFDSIKKIDGGYRLSAVLEKGYTGPLPPLDNSKPNNTSIWYLLPHQLRESTHKQTFHIWVDILRKEKDWSIHIQTDELEDVFTQVVFVFDENIASKGEGIENLNEGNYFWKEGKLDIQQEKNKMTLLAGEYEHWQKSLGNKNTGNNLAFYRVNLLSPIDKKFSISIS